MRMMKKEYIFLSVIIVILVLYIVLKNTDRTHYTLPEVKPIEKEEISRIILSRGDSSITLSRSADGWKIIPARYEADTKKVDQMLDEFRDLNITTLVSEAETYQRYGLTSGERIYARAFEDEKTLRQFYIGKTASTRKHTYVMFPGDGRVYEARNNIRRIFDKSVDGLRDKTVLTFEGTAASAMVIRTDGGETSLEKKMVPLPVEPSEEGQEKEPSAQREAKWVTAGGRTAKAESIKSMIRTLSNLKCNGYIQGKSKSDFTDPVYNIRVTANQEYSLTLYQKNEDDKYPAVSSDSEYPFLLSEWKAKQIMKKPEELLVEEDNE